MKLLSSTGAAKEKRSSADLSPYEDETCRFGSGLGRIRLVLGGTICGGFVGSFAGALCGVLYGTWVGDLSRGLDGALMGSLVAAALGTVYGLVCAAG